MAYIATVQLLLDVNNETEVDDAVGEILREQQRHFTASSCLLDWRFHEVSFPSALKVALPPDFKADDTWPPIRI